ncbi:MAG TPA: MBOAT family protein [Desulfobacterales bacterium]|nr:MBOAT family protein [Desulfobacterales bacterium]HIP38435.1 MBOAT family protein [Desulfocapsa sulfexigens]
MVFSSHFFLFYFLPLSLGLYYLMPIRGRNLLLTLLSYLFYGWSNPLFTLLMMFSTLVDYICGWVIGGTKPAGNLRKRKIALFISIITNLGLLGIFKYSHFALENYNLLLSTAGLDGLGIETGFRFILPLGISFYTFQSMSYSIDVYRGEAGYQRNFIDFACYVSMFPQLVAGPIIRFQEVANQLAVRTHTMEKFSRGVAFFCLGMAKKVLLANGCGKIADVCFSAGSMHWIDAWYGAIAYAFQIYFDFSGYSDMAIGLGLMFGFVFPKNFSSPYKSASITEFWRRWHISLSTWLREYLYIPLGGNRKGRPRTAINLLVVMFLGGLWHGASWNFIIWGLLHGGLLGFERSRERRSIYFKLRRPLRIGMTFVLVVVAWVFFRAETLPHALDYLGSMFGIAEVPQTSQLISGIVYQPYFLLVMLISSIVVWASPQTWDWTRELTVKKSFVIAMLMALSITLLTLQSYNPFIYFNF